MKYQQKSIGNPVKIYLEKFNLKLEIKNQKFNWKFKWTFEIHEITILINLVVISMNICSYFNETPMEIHWKSS